MKISAVIITLNEEKNIERCIRSLLPVVDEIIVWDSMSIDRTKEISESLGAIVYTHPWSGYSQSKNMANEKVSGDYILSIDADEELSLELQQSILQKKSTLSFDGYTFKRLNNYGGKWIKHSGWYPEYKVRLFKKDTALWEGEVHEQLEFKAKPTMGAFNGNLLHYSINSLEHHIQKIFLYSRLSSQKELNKGVKPTTLFHGVLRPAFHFIKIFFIQKGFLDGYEGFVIAKMSAFERFLRYVKLKELSRNNVATQGMTVMHLSSERYWRGGEQQIAYLIEELSKRNIASVVCARTGSSFERYCINKKIPLRSLGFSNAIDISTAWGILSTARKWGVDVIHIHSAKSHRLAVFASLLGCRIPMILSRRVNFTLHQNFSTRWKYNHLSIKKIVCVSHAIEANMRKFVRKAERCLTIHSGIDLLRFKNITPFPFKSHYGLPDDAIIIGTTAALDASKDPITFVRVIGQLRQHGLPAYGVIVGDGPLRNQVLEVAYNENLSGHVILTGFREDVKELLAGFDYFILSSIEEGLGTSVLDAFLATIPVIATNVGGIPEMVKHKVTGMLAPARDAVALTDGILQLHRSPELKKSVIAGATKAVMNFSKEEMAEKTMEVYTEVVFLPERKVSAQHIEQLAS